MYRIMRIVFHFLFFWLLLPVLSLTACKKNTPVEKVVPIDCSKTKAVINGRECHMFPGYFSDPDNRTFAGQENQDNVYLCFYSQNMAENYLAKNYRDNDTLYRITITFYAPEKDFHPYTNYSFNRTVDSTNVWKSTFESSSLNSYILFGTTISTDIPKDSGVASSRLDYTITSGWVSFGDIETEPHLLYGGDRFVWKCKEAFFEFDAISEGGKVMHVTDGYCCLY